MKLITKEIERRAKEIGTQDAEDPIVIAHFFNPSGQGDWFMIEWDPEDRVMFCYASLFNDENNELGYTSIDELLQFRGEFGLGIERELSWKECPLSEAKKIKGIV